MPSFDAIGEAYVRLRPKLDDNFEQDANKAVLPSLQRIATDAASLFAGKQLLNVGVAGLDELKQSQAVTAQTTQELKNLGGQTNVTSDQVDKLGQQMLDLAGFDDEAGRSAANVLLRFKEITDSQTLTRTENDAADLAVTMGTDLPSAARTLGLALEDPEKAIRLLRSANVVLDQSQQDALKSAAQFGDQQKVNDIILGAIESSIGGTAKAYGDTLAGSQDKASESLKNAKAELVEGFAPALQLGAGLASSFADEVSHAPGPVKELAGGIIFLGGGLASLVGPVSDVLRGLSALKDLRAASAAATTTESTANTANAASATAAAAAGGELATSEAAVATGAAAATAGLEAEAVAADTATASLAAMAIPIAAGVVAIGGLVKAFGEIRAGGNHVSVDIHKMASDSNADLLGIYNTAKNAFGGDGLPKLIDQLKNSGQEGVGVLQRMRDAVAATGGDTSKFDAALANAKTSQDNLNSSVKAGQQAVGEFNDAASDTSGLEAMKDAAKATDDALQSAKDRLQSLSDLASGAPGSDIAAQRAALGVEDARQREADAAQKLRDAQAGTAADAQGIADANIAIARAQQDINDATAKGDTLKEAEARNALAKAQEQLNKAQGSGADPAKVARAEEDLRRAHLDVKQAVLDAADAAAKYKDAQDALNGKLDDAQTKAANARDSLAFFAGQVGGPLAEELQPYIDQLTQVVGLQTQLSDLNAPDVPLKEYASGGVKRFASGGVAGPGDRALVGEDEPEWLRVNAFGQAIVTPTGLSRRSMSTRGGDTVSQVFHVSVVSPTAENTPSMIVSRLRRLATVRPR